jgi:hypothetical protein
MGERRILVIGSQCDALPRLMFLPSFAQDLYEAMIDPTLGQCTSALLNEVGLLLDPTVQQTKSKIRDAFRRASNDQVTLFLAYVGHGEVKGDDVYLLPKDANRPFNTDNAVYLVQVIREEFQDHCEVDGLVVLLDACFAGAAIRDVASRWVQQRTSRELTFELLTATSDHPAYDGCFTRTLTKLIREGHAKAESKNLEARQCTAPLKKSCSYQTPRLLSSLSGADPGLWIARNKAVPERYGPLANSEMWSLILGFTRWYQPPAVLHRLVHSLRDHRCVVVNGAAGSGKSALVSALARPEVTHGVVPDGYVHAVGFLSATTNAEELAGSLSWQLNQRVPSFAEGLHTFEMRTQANPDEWTSLNALQRKVIGPLRLLRPDGPVRLALDALDQAPEASSAAIVGFLETLATDPELSRVRVVVTTRPDTLVPTSAVVLSLERATDNDLSTYYTNRQVSAEHLAPAVRHAAGSWLVASRLAELAEREGSNFDPDRVPAGLIGLFDRELTTAGGNTSRWQQELRPILTVLATAGAGPVLPFPLFRRACQELGGPHTNASLRGGLCHLRGLVVRTNPGAEDEHVGLFHATFGEHLLQHSAAYHLNVKEGHNAILTAIQELAPVDRWDARNPDALQRYAFERHAEHLWEAGRREEVVDCLEAREANILRENLNVWSPWLERCTKEFGSKDRRTFRIRNAIAYWTGKAGDAEKALQLFQELLLDQQAALGPDHHDTLITRANIAYWTAEAGNPQEALRLCKELLPDEMRVLGPDHHDTLITRANIAYWTAEAGNPQEALRLCKELLPDVERVLGSDHPNTISVRINIARCTEDPQESLRLYEELLPDCERVFGPEHPTVRFIRDSIASLREQLGC